MKKMKKSLVLLLAALMLLSLFTACGQNTKPEETPSPVSEEAAPPLPPETEAPEEEEEYVLPPEDGCKQLTIYWQHPTADYSKCDVWVWFPGKDGSGQLFYPCSYGVKCMVNVPLDVSEVGFIVRRDCSAPGGSSWGSATKDVEEDRFVIMEDGDTVIYLQPGDSLQYKSSDGGVTLSPIREFTLAAIMSPTEIRYHVSPATRLESLDDVKVKQNGREIAVEALSSLNNEVVTGTITVAEPLDVSQAYTVEIKGFGEAPAIPTGLFDSEEFIRDYTYEGDDLGAVIHGDSTVFKVWAPTASRVKLRLFEAGNNCEAHDTLAMVKGDQGVWSVTAPCGHGTYYTYLVTTAMGEQEAVDPYAKAVGVNGERGMVVDLGKTDPSGFRGSPSIPALESYEQAVIWEVHVRDFSNAEPAFKFPGKYLAFTETGLTNSSGLPVGVDYLKQLGVTHVHLQPVYDYATVDESSTSAQFNWGYDPKNYNAPDGSYATDPYHGEVRVTEFKEMVQALHEQGIGVVMDVVYNHTYSIDSNLNKIVPYYYYRFGSDGSPSNGSGCGNETASERVMFRKYMVDSLLFWASEYQLDGFRFDLMALHDVETMQEIETELHELNPQILIYGEGWTGGTTPLMAKKQANQANIAKISASNGAIGSVAVFNDAIRDGLKGSVFDPKDPGYINGSVNSATAAKVIFGLLGGQKTQGISWSVENSMVINYMSSHDNNTLWDKLLSTCPEASEEERIQMNRFGAEIVMISRGTPFFLAGEELLRTKDGDSNSYASSDAVNNLDWESLTPQSSAWQTAEFYRELIALRKANAFLTKADMSCELLTGNAIAVTWTQNGKTVAYAVINPNAEAMTVTLPEGSWSLLLLGDEVTPAGGDAVSGEASVAPQTVLLVKAQ